MKRHDPDYFSLAAGLLFTLLGVVFALAAATGWDLDGRWLVPTMLIALGGGGVAASLSAARRQREADAALTSTAVDASSSSAWPGGSASDRPAGPVA